MRYNFFQKSLSFFLIFSLLFSVTFRLPFDIFFPSSVFARESEFNNLVSILVEEEIYNTGNISSRIERYARDIQSVLENTRTVIIPVPSDATVFDIASLNERLYQEGYKWVQSGISFESRLIGTVLIWNLPIPFVHDGDATSRSILPYVDFVDKAFVYDHDSDTYEKRDTAGTKLTPEIWHGVIQPNTGLRQDDLQALRDYFDKNHDYYRAQGVFSPERNILNWWSELWEDYEPFVFYYDQFRESSWLQYDRYVWYEMYLDNIEDLNYNRYTRELAERVSEKVLWIQNDEIIDLVLNVDPEFDIIRFQNNSSDISNAPEITTKYITDNVVNNFLEIFNGVTLSEMRKNVYNAGRYNQWGSQVNIDMPPFLISTLDEITSWIIKNVNTSLEVQITNLVANGLSRKIPVQQNANVSWSEWSSCPSTYTNFYYGRAWQNLETARDCSIFRGSTDWGTLVEANRGFNVLNVWPDVDICGQWMQYDTNSWRVISGLTWFWGWNSPVNLSQSPSWFSSLELWPRNLQRATRPLFDILGSKEIDDSTKIPSPLDCFQDGVSLLTYNEQYYTYSCWEGETCDGCRVERSIPLSGNNVQYYTQFTFGAWSRWIENRPTGTTSVSRYCAANNTVLNTTTSFDELFSQNWGGWFAFGWTCLVQDLRLWGSSLKTQRVSQQCSSDWDGWTTCEPCGPTTTYNFQSIPSYIVHTSPTDEEFTLISRNLSTPSLPVDKNRYVDFIGARWGAAPSYGYQRIDFPQLFRVIAQDSSELNLETLAEKTKEYLDWVSNQMNQVIVTANPSSLSGTDLEIYNLLRTGDYPEANIDLYASLVNRPVETLTLGNQEKNISYFDTLVFAIYWRNLWNASSKYKFIFENYLSNQFESDESQNFVLPRHKNSYEIGYFAAPWDAANMYIKLDPEQKMQHPYADIIAANMSLRGTLAWTTVSDFSYDEGPFKCWPPDWVMIWEWIPAIICWLQDMLPPKIKIGESSCSMWDLFLNEEEREELEACQWDANKNGVNDCLEAKLIGWNLILQTDGSRYYYNTFGNLYTELYDNEWVKAQFDSISYIQFYLDYVDVPRDRTQIFNEWNTVRIYDRKNPELSTLEAKKEALNYVNFTESRIRVMWWESKTFFSVKWLDANIAFSTELTALDTDGNKVINLQSESKEIEVRGDRLFLNTFRVDSDNIITSWSNIQATENDALYITTDADNITELLPSTSPNTEKLIFWVYNYSDTGQRLELNYPLEIILRDQSDWRILLSETIDKDQIGDIYPLTQARESGRYELLLRDSDGRITARVFDIFPDIAERLEVNMSTTVKEVWGNISTHLAHFYDRFDNIASGQSYTLEMSIQWDGVVFENNNSKQLTLQVFEWFRPFRLKSTLQAWQNQIQFTLRNISWQVISQISRSIQVVESIEVQVQPLDWVPRVWWEVYRYRLLFTDTVWNRLTSLRSRASLSILPLYGRPSEGYVEFENGEVILSLQTRELAWRSVALEFQLEGGNNHYPYLIDIHPEAPIKVDLNLSRDKIEASPEDSSILEAVLKDRYDNVVFTDSSTQISLELHERSNMIAWVSESTKVSRAWKAQFQIFWTDIPGTAYFKVGTSPSLWDNSFRLDGQAPFLKERLIIPGMKDSTTWLLTERGSKFFRDFSESYFITRFSTLLRLEENEDFLALPITLQDQLRDFWNQTNFLEVQGIGENAGMLETFYFWNKDAVDGRAYNTLHTTLLGSNYWDVSEENYLAWSLLFDRSNAAISVTSLLNTPYKFWDVFQLKRDASFQTLISSDITQDIRTTLQIEPNGILKADIVNEALSAYIGKIYFLTRNSEYLRFDVRDASYSVQTNRDNITTFVGPAWNKLFRFSPQAGFEKFWQVQLSIDSSHTWAGTKILLSDERVAFWEFTISWEFDIDVTRDNTLAEQKKQNFQDTLLIELASNQYSSRTISDGREEYSVFYYHDPFAVRNTLDIFHNYDLIWGESISDEDGIGWKDENLMMLSLASWERVWEATKNFMSFSLIQLWDPVFSLAPISHTFLWTDQEKSFDPTIGKIISNEGWILRFEVFDYNNDDRDDILTIHRDGYMRLYERADIEKDYIFQRNLIYASDGWSARHIKTWDFSWDGFDDIFFVDESWAPQLYNNVSKDFVRIDLSDQITMSGSIVQVEVFDMDSDTRDDLVILDSSWEIHIWYGGWESVNPQFTKKFIGDGYSIQLSDTPISHGWVIYFDGLTSVRSQNAQSIIEMSDTYLAELQASIDNGTEAPAPEFIDEGLINSFLYVPLLYRPTNYTPETTPQEQLLDNFSSSIDTVSIWEFWENQEDIINALDNFTSEWDRYIQYSAIQRSQSQSTFFLRSEYAWLEWIEVRKTFTDATPPHLQTWDSVYLDISLTNTSSTRKNNIAYADMLPKFFTFKNNEMIILSEDERILQRGGWVWIYQIFIDWFYLDPGEETTIRIELEALPLQYGHMQVGIYEQWEPGFDIYGDIILKDSDTNCWQIADIFRSIAVREYLKWETVPRCDNDALDIGNTFPGLLDANNSWVPDYLEEILSLNQIEDIQAYSREALEEFFDVTLPEQYRFEESESNWWSDSPVDLMWMVDMVNEMTDEILWQLDEIIQWLSCGFWGWSCISMPLNWAPLAPGSVPTLFGMPMGALTPSTWVPIFSWLTGRQTSCGISPCCLPSVYPANATAYVPWPVCWSPSAGWSLWTWSPFNNVRLYVTPTLTGAVGIAACFWGPAIVAWNANPMWVHPLVPGWNCVVAAMPLLWCNGDEGDPSVLWYPYISDNLWLIQANCPVPGREGATTPREIFTDFVRDYLEYQRTGVMPAPLFRNYERALSDVSLYWSESFQFPSEPLISFWSWEEGLMSLSVDLDLSALASWDFQDVVQIENKRTPGFPWFLMDWVERQLDEVTSKLTNLPKIFIILPEFWGVFDYSFADFWEGIQESFQEWARENDEQKAQDQWRLQSLREQRAALDCSWNDRFRCTQLNAEIAVANAQSRTWWAQETLSWIKQVYEFIGKIPLVNIETETVIVSVPWIDPSELNRFITDWSYWLEQMQVEVDNAKNSWSFWAACNESTSQAQEACEQQNDIRRNASLEVDEFMNSVRYNVEILKSYAEIPERLAKLINIKEVWLEQILCNIEAIAELMGKWINENGQRFKAWVEVFLLVKAALKSWQSLIDVFIEYEESCHECKNERQDLQGFIWKLISAVIPSPPIIEFPKWPDIILDFHNIRAGMTIYMPDFDINWTPLVLPNLPNLSLPTTPSVNLSLPALPLLPAVEIPELPDLPALPTIELPDLPPPPKIPKLFWAVEVVLNIWKLVTKIMCIIKGSPFVPEWRAGDQIAYITERNGYIPGLDFINFQPPAFSYSAISAIKVTTYVNFEFEFDFIVEMARAVVEPINGFTSNIANLFDMQISNLDLSEALPSEINIDLNIDGSIETTLDDGLWYQEEQEEYISLFVGAFANYFARFVNYLVENQNELYTSDEFKQYLAHQMSSESFTEDQSTKKIQDIWSTVFNMNFTKEDGLIDSLREYNESKFSTLESIIQNEIDYTKKQKEALENMTSPHSFIQTSFSPEVYRFEAYRELMEWYNMETLDAIISLASWPSEEQIAFEQELQRDAQDITDRTQNLLWRNQDVSPLWRYNRFAVTTEQSTWNSSGALIPSVQNSCDISWEYQYRYEGIYILEDDRNYRLFDYTDLLRGDEQTYLNDIDSDSDNDVLYLMNGILYFKENKKEAPIKSYISERPLIIPVRNNIFFQNSEVYHESVNGFKEVSVSNGAINVAFERPTDSRIKNFRMTYHTIVDKYLARDDSVYTPETVQTHIVDAIADIDVSTLVRREDTYTLYNHAASFYHVGAVNWLKLTTPKLQNIRESIEDNIQVTLTPRTRLYTWSQPASITFARWENTETQNIPARSSVAFRETTEIRSISGDAYVSLGIQEDIFWTDVVRYIWLPLFPNSVLSYEGDTAWLTESANVQIWYYDDSRLDIDLREVRSYTLYDLWSHTSDIYRIRLNIPNDFYYARLQSFQNNILSTLSEQILLSPQAEADRFPPEIGFTQKIRIPVYQVQEVDFTPYIYEDSGIQNIDIVRIDFDIDSEIVRESWSDRANVVLRRTPSRIAYDFRAFEELMDIQIRLTLSDSNGNIVSRNIPFEVYAPIPKIDAIDETLISWRIDERLTDEPIRLYRYRWGSLERLQTLENTDFVLTQSWWLFDFSATEISQGLILSYSWVTLASIDEYTGMIDIQNFWVNTRVLPNNSPENTWAYPQIILEYLWIPIFRQYIVMPLGSLRLLQSSTIPQEEWIYVSILEQESFSSYSIPLSAPYNPGAISIYRTASEERTPVMTLLPDGRLTIDQNRYILEYRESNGMVALMLLQRGSNLEIAKITYNLQGSYIIR